jgi:hypothetical protein
LAFQGGGDEIAEEGMGRGRRGTEYSIINIQYPIFK